MKNIPEKLLSSLLYSLFFLLFTFTGTLQAETEKQNDSNVINMVYSREPTLSLLTDRLKQFEQSSGYKVNLVFIHLDDLKPLLIKGALNNSLPDVVLAPSDFSSLAPLINLSKLPDSLLSEELMPEALNSMYYQGDYYGVPVMGGNHLMLFYNKKYVQKPAKNWQELKAQAAGLRAQGIEPIGWNYPEMYWFTGFAATFGGSPLNQGKPSLNSNAYADALVFYKELSDSGLVDPACDYDCAHKDFQKERFAYSINGEWALSDFEKTFAENLGIAVIPSIGDKPFRPLFSTAGLIFPNNSLQGDKKEAMQALALFFQSQTFQDSLFTEKRFLPVNQKSFKQVQKNASQNIKMLLKQLAQAKPMLPDPIMANTWIGMKKGFERYMAGVSSAQDAVSYMQKFTERDYQKSQASE